jgi:hypothetical protein
MDQQDLGAVARGILDANLYMVLGTADDAGHPWVSPVYYSAAGYSEFYWVSSPEARHSRNLAARPQLSIVVFDSQVPIGTGQAVYMAAVAEQLSGDELDRGIEIFSRVGMVHGGRQWTSADVVPPALYRLYRATVSDHWVLEPDSPPDHRTPVTL